MKVEVGESLVLSWMRHVLGCRVVQMNWKPSSTWELADKSDPENLLEDLKDHLLQAHGLEVFDQGEFDQTIRQGEIDVLGLRFDADGKSFLHTADVAFHGARLQYGTPEETINRVLKKLIRTAVTVQGYFPGLEADLVFATPVAQASLVRRLEHLVGDLNERLKSHASHLRARVLCNDRFRSEIIGPVIARSGAVADTSEIFLRSLQLLTRSGFSVMPPPTALAEDNPRIVRNSTPKPSPEADGWQIGDYVNTRFRQFVVDGRITAAEVERLLSKPESKAIFGPRLGYAFLHWLDTSHRSAAQARVALPKEIRVRYWADPVIIRGQTYLICSEWWRPHREELRRNFDAWAAKLPLGAPVTG